MIKRIQLIMKSRNISAAQFADEIGVQRSSVSHILTGRNNPSLDIILKILQRFPEVNSDWILTGNGAMLKSDIGKDNTSQQIRSFTNSDAKNSIINTQDPEDLFGSLNINVEKAEKPVSIQQGEKEIEEKKIENEEIIKNPEGDRRLSSFRTIDQIVIFYSDKTFSYYTPNN